MDDNVSVILGPRQREDIRKAVTDAIAHIHEHSNAPDISQSIVNGLEYTLDQLEPLRSFCLVNTEQP